MLVWVLVLGLVALCLAVMVVVQRRRLAEATTRATALSTTLSERTAELDDMRATSERLEGDVAAATARETLAADRADAAERRSAAAEAQRALKPYTAGGPDIDPHVLWTMEQARSERVWRLSVAAGPDVESVFDDAPDPLEIAVRIEVDAAREEVGTEVALEYGLGDDEGATISAAGAVVVLRAAQELLAGVVRSSETVMMRIVREGSDVIIAVDGRDEFENPVEPSPLAMPDSAHVDRVAGGLRVRHAFDTGGAQEIAAED